MGGGRHTSSGDRVAVAMLGKETKVEKNHSIGDKKRKSDGKGASPVKFIRDQGKEAPGKYFFVNL